MASKYKADQVGEGQVAALEYRADHVGSFLRPPELLAARERSDGATLKAIEDKHILRVLAKQKELGFEIFTDGELRRRNFMSNFTDAVEGFDLGGEIARDWGGQGAGPASARQPRHRYRQLESFDQVRPLTGARAAVPQEHSPGDIKMTAAERDAVSRDLIQEGRHGQGLQGPFRAALGHRRDHEEGYRARSRPKA